jgi:acetylornithine/N-succinyldiaminopimelate aminotransferase
MNQRELFLKHVAQTSDMPFSGVDMNITKAFGSILTDAQGKEYIDLISGISVSNVGHCHPKVTEAIHAQSNTYMHLMVYGEFNQAPQVKYAQTLAALLPEQLNSVYFTTGGSEAVEAAMKLAKRVTGRSEIISFKNAYHGSTQGALSLMSDESFKNSFRPLLPDVRFLEYNNLAKLDEISGKTACVIVEPVQGEAGVKAANPDFLRKLREKCDAHCTLLIFDEIQSGFGRTGKLFAFQKYDVTPDVLLLAKGMGGGLPIGAFVSSSGLMGALTNNPVLGHMNTFGGNAVCVAAAQAALDLILEEELVDKAAQIESLLRANLRHPLIKEVRAVGALAAIEFGDEAINFEVIKKCIDAGVITDWFLFCSTAMRVAPPLNISLEILMKAIKTILEVLDGMEKG